MLQPQLKNADEIKGVLKEVEVKFELEDGREVETLLVFLPITAGQSDCSKLFEVVKDGIFYNFVFDCSEVEKKLGVQNPEAAEELLEKAIRKLSQHTAKGELGELILFTLLDVYLEAPKILSKISFKTSRRMPVFGADGVHGQFVDGKFRLFLGESKLHEKFKGGASDAATSMRAAKDNYNQEFDLLDSHMDFPNIKESSETELLKLLNPFENGDVSDVIYSPCFIGFTEPDLISNCSTEEEFIEKYEELAAEYVEDFFAKVEKQGLEPEKTILLMLPFSCVDDLAKQFITYFNIEA